LPKGVKLGGFMEETENVGNGDAVNTPNEEVKVEPQKPEVKTFTRDEVNKMIATEKAKAVDEAKKQAEADRTESEKLAKMKDDEKANYEKVQAEKKANEAIKELNAYKLKDQTSQIIADKKMPSSFVDFFDYNTAKADEIEPKLEKLSVDFNKAVDEALQKKLGEKPPVGKQSNLDPDAWVNNAATVQKSWNKFK